MSSIQEACIFTGPPSPMYGDAVWPGFYADADAKEPYRLVREAAEGAREALEGHEFYHQVGRPVGVQTSKERREEYKELSRRIVGFGNYEPPEDRWQPHQGVGSWPLRTQSCPTAR